MHRPTAGGGSWPTTVLIALLVFALVGAGASSAVAIGDGEPSTAAHTDAVTAGVADTDAAVTPASAITTATTVTAATTRAAAQPSFDRSTVSITVYRNGSARWAFRYVRPLENESEREAFAAYADRFNAEETDLYRSFRRDSRSIVARGQNVTGREMSATGFSRHAEIRRSLGNDLGVVRMSFIWTGFADVSGSLVEVGDVFEGGLYLGPDQTLVFHPGPDLVFTEALPEATWSNASSLRASDSVTWEGEKQFTDNRPYVALEPAGAAGPDGATTTANTPSGTPATSTPSPSGGVPTGLLGFVLVVVLVVGGAGWYRRRGESGTTIAADAHETAEPTSPGPGSAPAEPASTGGAATDQSGSTAAESTQKESAAEGSAASADSTVGIADERLLSDEGRVVALLEANDGQMKQSEIVDETGWSKSKVSMLLSDMADEARIEKLRLGRENVISLTEAERSDDGGDQ